MQLCLSNKNNDISEVLVNGQSLVCELLSAISRRTVGSFHVIWKLFNNFYFISLEISLIYYLRAYEWHNIWQYFWAKYLSNNMYSWLISGQQKNYFFSYLSMRERLEWYDYLCFYISSNKLNDVSLYFCRNTDNESPPRRVSKVIMCSELCRRRGIK